MTQGINLLVPTQKPSSWQTQFSRLAKAGSLVLLLFYLLVAGGIFFFWFQTQRRLTSLGQERAAQEKKVADLKNIESSQVLLKQRLSALKEFFGVGTVDHEGVLVYLNSSMADQIEAGEISFSKGEEAGVGGVAANAQALANFLDQISGEEGEKWFSRAVLASLTRREDGSYLFDLNLEVKGD